MENFERFHEQNERVRKLEDDANIKATVLAVAKEILPETILMHGLGSKEYKVILAELEKEIVEAKTNNVGELQAITARAINTSLEKMHMEKPAMATKFLEKMKHEMEVH